MRPKFPVLVTVLVAAVAVAAVVLWSRARWRAAPESNPPRFVTYHLARVHLLRHPWATPKEREMQARFDPQSDYIVSSLDGPDGCELILSLRPAERASWRKNRAEMKQTYQSATLDLVTGRGVAIGDTPQQVETNIGRPTRVEASGKVGSDVVFVYSHRAQRLYTARYTFKANALSEVEFKSQRLAGARNFSDGCS